jgi:SPP1 gp7 family putative phage head morphogenesis protein
MSLIKAQTDLGTTVDDLAPQTQGDAGAITSQTEGKRDLVLIFRTRRDGRVRPEHAALEGHVWELDDGDAPNPPLAPNCRCQIAIVPRETAVKSESSSAPEALAKFKNLEANLAKVYPSDVVAAYREHLLPADVIIQRTGDRITTDQARAIIASRVAGADPKYALNAVASLADRGLSGRILGPIVTDARLRIAQGANAREAAKAAILATEQRGYVTARTVEAAADELVRSRLLDGVDPAPSAERTGGIPPAGQPDQRKHEGQPLRVPTVPPPWGRPGNPPKAPAYIFEAERQIARRTTERLLAWDEAGNLVASSEGGVDYANVPPGIPAGSTVSHNHPSGQKYDPGQPRSWGTSLSGDDIHAARSGNWLAIRAVTPSGAVFEMRRPPGGWPSEVRLRSALKEARAEIEQQLSLEIQAGRMDATTAGGIHAHRVNLIVAKSIGAKYHWGIHE